MMYRGYEIKRVEKKNLIGASVRGFGIYYGDKLITIATEVGLARRVIDDRIKSGRLSELDAK